MLGVTLAGVRGAGAAWAVFKVSFSLVLLATTDLLLSSSGSSGASLAVIFFLSTGGYLHPLHFLTILSTISIYLQFTGFLILNYKLTSDLTSLAVETIPQDSHESISYRKISTEDTDEV